MLAVIESLRDLNTASLILRLLLAMACGGLIGLERGKKFRPAGFRTYMLVCLGATLTMLLGQYEAYMIEYAWHGLSVGIAPPTDITRFSAQVINGIGFLGAGTIIVTDKREVKGLTTAAGLWASACMGLAIGAGFYECVILAFFLIFLSIRILPLLEAIIIENARNMNIYVEFQTLDNVGEIIACIKSQQVLIYEIDIDRGDQELHRYPSAMFEIRLKKRRPHTQVISAIAELECVKALDEI